MNNQQNFQQRGPPNGGFNQIPGGPGGPGRPMMGPGGNMMGPNPGMGQRPGGMGQPGQFQTNYNMPNQNMMGDRPTTPEKPKKLKFELTNKERGYYSNMLSKVQAEGSSRVEGKTAVNFFKTSGVELNILKGIWKT